MQLNGEVQRRLRIENTIQEVISSVKAEREQSKKRIKELMDTNNALNLELSQYRKITVYTTPYAYNYATYAVPAATQTADLPGAAKPKGPRGNVSPQTSTGLGKIPEEDNEVNEDYDPEDKLVELCSIAGDNI